MVYGTVGSRIQIFQYPDRRFMMHCLTLLAQGTSGQTGPHGDTLPALLLVLCLALGMVLLCRSSGRSSESKLERLDEE